MRNWELGETHDVALPGALPLAREAIKLFKQKKEGLLGIMFFPVLFDFVKNIISTSRMFDSTSGHLFLNILSIDRLVLSAWATAALIYCLINKKKVGSI